MADVELPDLPAVVTIADSDLLHVRQGVEDKKSTVATLEVHLDTKYLRQDDNLASLNDDAAARANLGVISESEGDAKYLEELNNLSDLTNVTVARNNLGLGTLATQNEGTGGADFRDNTANDARFLLEANNLSDLTSASTARTNLGLGTLAVQDEGTTPTTFRDNQANDARFLQVSNNLSDVADDVAAFNNIKQPAAINSTGVVEKATISEANSGVADKYPDAALLQTAVEAQTGWGGGLQSGPVNLDDITIPGNYWVTGTVSNLPVPYTSSVVHKGASGSAAWTQITTVMQTGQANDTYIRSKDTGGTIQPWKKVVYESSFEDTTVSSGNFTSGTIYARRNGDVVTIWGKLFHPSDTNPATAAAFLPEEFRPSNNWATNCYIVGNTPPNLRYLLVSSTGSLQFVYLNSSFLGQTDTDTEWFSISYVVPN
jgi:hypothetical protein